MRAPPLAPEGAEAGPDLMTEPAPAPDDDEEDEMFCTRCGARNDDTAKFCVTCGAPLMSAEQLAGTAPAAPQPAAPEPVAPEPVAPDAAPEQAAPAPGFAAPEGMPAEPPAAEPVAAEPVSPVVAEEPAAEPGPVVAEEPASEPQPATAPEPAAEPDPTPFDAPEPEQPAPWVPQPSEAVPSQPAPWAPQLSQPAPSQPAPQQPAPWAPQPGQAAPQQPPAAWTGQPQQPPTFEQPGQKRRTGLIIGIVATFLVICAIVGVVIVMGVVRPSSGTTSSNVDTDVSTSAAAEVTMPDYCDPAYFSGKSLADIRAALEGQGFEIVSVFGYESGNCDVSFSGTPASVPSNSEDDEVFISLYLDSGTGASMTGIESVDQVPADARVNTVSISYTADIEPDDYIVQAKGIADAFGLGDVMYGVTNTQEQLEEAAETFDFDVDSGWINDVEDYDFDFSEISVSGMCEFYGEDGSWYVSISDFGYGTDVFISYDAPY